MDVAIIFGSASDKEKMAGAAKCLDEFGLEYKAYIASAHRVPELLENILKEAVDSGAKAIIAGAGLAAHLPGVIASSAGKVRSKLPEAAYRKSYAHHYSGRKRLPKFYPTDAERNPGFYGGNQ